MLQMQPRYFAFFANKGYHLNITISERDLTSIVLEVATLRSTSLGTMRNTGRCAEYVIKAQQIPDELPTEFRSDKGPSVANFPTTHLPKLSNKYDGP